MIYTLNTHVSEMSNRCGAEIQEKFQDTKNPSEYSNSTFNNGLEAKWKTDSLFGWKSISNLMATEQPLAMHLHNKVEPCFSSF